MMPERETIRGFAIIIAIAAVATVFWSVSSGILAAILGAFGLIFICLLWYFGYSWYHRNRMAISLMPDKQRAILYGGLGAVTVAAALYSLSQFKLRAAGNRRRHRGRRAAVRAQDQRYDEADSRQRGRFRSCGRVGHRRVDPASAGAGCEVAAQGSGARDRARPRARRGPFRAGLGEKALGPVELAVGVVGLLA
jgi:hypothetical protein